MAELLEILRQFNRKERFYLVGSALGNADFKLCANYRNQIQNLIGISVPEDAFVAMDYHIDWIYASIFLFQNKEHLQPFSRENQKISGSQEDADLFVCFFQNNAYYMILIEAKVESNWSNEQLQSKANRYGAIFGKSGDNFDFIKPYFIITSPKEPSNISSESFPEWIFKNGKIPFLKLEVPQNLIKITRCMNDGSPNQEGNFWIVESGKDHNNNPQNYDKYSSIHLRYNSVRQLPELVEIYKEQPNIFIGFSGGLAKLKNSTFEEITSRPNFKWTTSIEQLTKKNWIPATDFFNILTEKYNKR